MTALLPPTSWRDRLFAKSIPDANGCWIWTGSLLPEGYGLFQGPTADGGRRCTTAHRWAYIAAYGDVADGLHIDHLCNVPKCINPRHLEPVTPQENIRRRDERRRAARGGKCLHGHEMTEENTYRNRGRERCIECLRLAKKRHMERAA